jgi:hypothetical protein
VVETAAAQTVVAPAEPALSSAGAGDGNNGEGGALLVVVGRGTAANGGVQERWCTAA